MAERTLISFDWAIKTLLRQKDNFDILEGFLSVLLNDNIKILKLLESESNKNNVMDKGNRVDLLAEDNKERQIIIEVQYSKEIDFLERLYYGTSRVLIDNMKEGYRCSNVKKIISVSIVYFDLMKEDYIIQGKTVFKGRHTGKEMSMGNIFAEYHIIQTKWFNDNIKNELDEWIYMFKHSKVKEEFTSKGLKIAGEKLNIMQMTEEERRVYEKHRYEEAIQDSITAQSILEAELKGEQAGLQKGLQEGKKEGEYKKSIEIARNALHEKLPADVIVKLTGLDIGTVEDIAKGKI